jgi:hypothetical protein
VSPDDEPYAKFDFYAAHGVEDIIIGDPQDRAVRCFRVDGARYTEARGSRLLVVDSNEMTAGITWPARPGGLSEPRNRTSDGPVVRGKMPPLNRRDCVAVGVFGACRSSLVMRSVIVQ